MFFNASVVGHSVSTPFNAYEVRGSLRSPPPTIAPPRNLTKSLYTSECELRLLLVPRNLFVVMTFIKILPISLNSMFREPIFINLHNNIVSKLRKLRLLTKKHCANSLVLFGLRVLASLLDNSFDS